LRWRRVFGEVRRTPNTTLRRARVPSHGGLVADETLNRRTSGLTKSLIFTPLG
jgi:hypothetical protein